MKVIDIMQTKNYKVGIYIRLSKEDEEKVCESESVTNQRTLILKYIKENNYEFISEYVDDGYSGTDFNRPSFQRMLRDIEKKKIDMVITKDLSRLGRDYIMTGYYIEKYFPEHNIRYISILDNIDTLIDGLDNDIIPFKALLNDMYAKDISKKVKISLKTKKEQGLFLGWKACYGYRKDPNNKHKLIIDEAAAVVVKKIFLLALKQNTPTLIANILLKEKIKTPRAYYMNYDGFQWCARTIIDILTNPTYIGHLSQGKRKKLNYKSKKEIRIDKTEWITTYSTHEPIIEEKVFKTANNILEIGKRKYSKENYLLNGLLFCEECGHTINIIKSNDKKRAYTSCSTYRKKSKLNICFPHCINYNKLEKMILDDVGERILKKIDKNVIKEYIKNHSSGTSKKDLIENKISLLNQNLETIYIDKINGIINEDLYKKLSLNINKNIIQEKSKLLSLYKNNKSNEIYELLNLDFINKELIINIINKIIIDKNKNITIVYKIKNNCSFSTNNV